MKRQTSRNCQKDRLIDNIHAFFEALRKVCELLEGLYRKRREFLSSDEREREVNFSPTSIVTATLQPKNTWTTTIFTWTPIYAIIIHNALGHAFYHPRSPLKVYTQIYICTKDTRGLYIPRMHYIHFCLYVTFYCSGLFLFMSGTSCWTNNRIIVCHCTFIFRYKGIP